MDDRITERLERLYMADFGDRDVMRFRRLAVGGISLLMILITQEMFYLVWLVFYFSILTLYWLTVRPEALKKEPGMGRLRVAQGLYLGCSTTFFQAPAFAMGLEEPIFYLAAGLAISAAALHMLQRPQTGPEQVFLNAMAFIFGISSCFFYILPLLTSWQQIAISLMICCATGYYFVKINQRYYQHQVAERDAQLRYARALRAQALGQFVGGVAHDFNNLLTAINGHLELYDLEEDPAAKKTALREARNATGRAGLMVKQLLSSSGRARLRPVPTDLSALTERLGLALRDLLEETTSLRISGSPLLAQVDPDGLETCIIQLCLNAQDALRPHGGGTIHLSVKRFEHKPGHEPPIKSQPPYAAIMVEDDGPGVPEEALEKLAEPFYTTKGVGEGSGLGLSAVGGFAHQSGGGLHLENGPTGLRAYILLPMA